MARVGVLLPTDGYVNGWVKSSVLVELSQEHDIVLISNSHTIDAYLPKQSGDGYRFSSSVDFEFRESLLIKLSQRALMFEFRKRSNSFVYRIERERFGLLRKFPPLRNLLNNSRYFFGTWIKHPRLKALEFFTNYALIFSLVRQLCVILGDTYTKRKSKLLQACLTQADIDVLLIPTSGGETHVPIAIYASRLADVITILVIENWDNLSSKTVLKNLPDYVTSLGPQTSRHALAIHNYSKNQILEIGLPKFNLLDRYQSKHRIFQPNSDLVIGYMGTLPPHNEIRFLNKILSESQDYFGVKGLKIIYRQHPSQAKRRADLQLTQVNKSVVLHLQQDLDTNVNVDQSYLAQISDLIANTHFIISTPTTALLEAILLGGKIILDGHDDGYHRTTAAFCLKKMTHLQEILNMKDLIICENAHQIVQMLKSFQQNPQITFPTPSSISQIIADDIKFSTKLSQEISRITLSGTN